MSSPHLTSASIQSLDELTLTDAKQRSCSTEKLLMVCSNNGKLSSKPRQSLGRRSRDLQNVKNTNGDFDYSIGVNPFADSNYYGNAICAIFSATFDQV